MSKTKKTARFLFYPAVRVSEQFSESAQRLRERRDQLRESRAQAQASIALPGSSGMTAAERFEAVASAKGWTQEGLDEQLMVVRRSKRWAMVGGLIALICAMATMFVVPVWALLFMAPAFIGVASAGFARVFQFGLYQYQLERRALVDFRQYLSDPKLFHHLVS